MPEMPRIDEFVFILLAGLVLILIFMFAWTVPPEERVNVTVPVVGEVSLPAVYVPEEIEVRYALGLDVLDSKENVKVASGLLTSKEISLVGTVSEGKLAEVTDAFVVVIVDSTNKLKPLIVTVNDIEVYKDIPQPGTVLIPIEKAILKTKNVITIRTEFPGLLRFWKTSEYELKEAKFGVNIYGPAFKDFEFNLEKLVVKFFEHARLEYKITDRVGEGSLIVKINEQQILKGMHLIGEYEKTLGPAVANLKEGKNVLSFSVEPGTAYKLKDISLTIVYERR